MPEGKPLTRIVELDFGSVVSVESNNYEWKLRVTTIATEGSGSAITEVSGIETKELRELGEALIGAAQNLDYSRRDK